jgi:hypothetical protein
MDYKENFNKKLLDIGSQSIKIYFNKHEFNLRVYIIKRLIELKGQKYYSIIFKRKAKIEMINAYVKSLKENCK